MDPANDELLGHAEVARGLRERRLRVMVGRLWDQGIEVSFPEVVAGAPDRGTLGRPHLAWALVRKGYVSTFSEAFDRFIGNFHPAYIPTRLIDPVEAIRLIEGAGGIPIWAHPPAEHVERLLPALRNAGLKGIEVYRPRTRRDRMLALERIALEEDLLISGGSDWHGPEQGSLGDFRVDRSEVARLLEAGGM